MPEGDTVWRTAHHLREVLEGRELVRSDVRVPQWATLDLSGRTVDEVLSRGKHLLIRVGDASIHSHLKMEGAWHVLRRGSRWRRPAHTARIVLETEQHQAIGFQLGLLEILKRENDDDALAYLGPDLLGPDWDLAEATRRVESDPDRPIFVALLDQRNLAGLGNEYVNEMLLLSGARRQQGAGGADVHGQHPSGRGALGLPARARPLPTLRHPAARRRARRPAGPRADHLLVSALPDVRSPAVRSSRTASQTQATTNATRCQRPGAGSVPWSASE